MSRVKRFAAVAAAAALTGCSSIGRVDVIGEFDISPGTCEADVDFEFIQANGTVASGTLSTDDIPFGGEYDDDDVNYRQPMRIHLFVRSSTAACPPELRQGLHYYWPDQNAMGTLPPAGNGRFRVDVRDFKRLQVTPGSERR